MTSTTPPPPPETARSAPERRGLIALAWLWVGLPLAYGVYELVQKATQLFTG
ncbi:MFS transporter small subunit [Streptomyces endophyticus]